MTHAQSSTRADAAALRPSALRARLVAPLCLTFFVCLTCGAGAEGARGFVAAAAQADPAVIRLRSFAPGVSGRLEVGPAGARSRLAASNLPLPGALTPDARAYVVWATGGSVRRLGVLRRTDDGAGALEFAHPAGFARYGVVVTAETSSDAARPAGAPVLSTRALEVAAVRRRPGRERAGAGRSPGASAPRRERVVASAATPRGAGAATVETEARSKLCAGRGCASTDFDGEVRRALASAGARTLLLVGPRRARGVARVANLGGAAYARLRLSRVPPPSLYGARRHILWAVTDEAGPVYMGSLPAAGLNRAQTLVRTEGVGDPNFRLLVTAERTYPAPRPAGRRVLRTFKGRRAARRPRKS